MDRRVVEIDFYGKPIALYNSIKDCAEKTGFPVGAIKRCVEGHQYDIYGRFFKYEVTATDLRKARVQAAHRQAERKLKEWDKFFKD